MRADLDLLIKGGRAVTPAGHVELDIGIKDGRIVSLGNQSRVAAAEEIDAKGLEILPGVIDTQVHFREPGLTHKEDLAAGSAAAVMGGTTTVFEMPNTVPATTSADALKAKLDAASGRMWCDHAFFVGATPDNISDLAVLERHPGCAGIKIFMGSSTGSLLVKDEATLFEALRHGRRRVPVHCEDEDRLIERKAALAGDGIDAAWHPVWRDESTALQATERLVRLARIAGRPVHVLHVSTAEEMAFLARNKDIATVEVTPQHLSLEAPECYQRLGSLAQMNPPLRDARHRQALWLALHDGVVDVLGSDHAPHTLEEKAKPYPGSPSGMPGVQTLLTVMLDHVNQGRLSLERLVDLTSGGPARIYGIAAKGRIAAGYDADLVLVDLKMRREIEKGWLQSRCGWSPFEGMTVQGWPVLTLLRGRCVVREDELLGAPFGAAARFIDTLAGGAA